jgi:RES domain-containing protein
MLAWRICRRGHLKSALSGTGAEKHAGRWNLKGERMVYAASSLSLAALELFVHLEPSCAPNDLHSVKIEIPDRVSREAIRVNDLPRGWRRYPAPRKLREIGSQWLRECRTLILIVPSAANPEEQNILINPAHREMKKLKVIGSNPFRFDPRMWK